MKTPRAISGDELVKLLQRFGYRLAKQKGSHMKTDQDAKREHHLVVPRHGAVRLGTLHRIIGEVAGHFEKEISEVRCTIWSDR